MSNRFFSSFEQPCCAQASLCPLGGAGVKEVQRETLPLKLFPCWRHAVFLLLVVVRMCACVYPCTCTRAIFKTKRTTANAFGWTDQPATPHMCNRQQVPDDQKRRNQPRGEEQDWQVRLPHIGLQWISPVSIFATASAL